MKNPWAVLFCVLLRRISYTTQILCTMQITSWATSPNRKIIQLRAMPKHGVFTEPSFGQICCIYLHSAAFSMPTWKIQQCKIIFHKFCQFLLWNKKLPIQILSYPIQLRRADLEQNRYKFLVIKGKLSPSAKSSKFSA